MLMLPLYNSGIRMRAEDRMKICRPTGQASTASYKSLVVTQFRYRKPGLMARASFRQGPPADSSVTHAANGAGRRVQTTLALLPQDGEDIIAAAHGSRKPHRSDNTLYKRLDKRYTRCPL